MVRVSETTGLSGVTVRTFHDYVCSPWAHRLKLARPTTTLDVLRVGARYDVAELVSGNSILLWFVESRRISQPPTSAEMITQT